MSKKYFAFLSYTHSDGVAAAALCRFLETFRVPVRLGGRELHNLPKRLFPIFRDRDELSGSTDLGATLRQALSDSNALVVLCSPEAAQSPWVNEELREFRRVGDPGRIFSVLLRGEPGEAFPEALTETGDEPLAIDFRASSDKPRDSRLRLVAALLGVDFDALKRRDLMRRRSVGVRIAALVAILLVLTTAGVFRYEFIADAQRAEHLAEISTRVGNGVSRELFAARSYEVMPTPITERALLQRIEAWHAYAMLGPPLHELRDADRGQWIGGLSTEGQISGPEPPCCDSRFFAWNLRELEPAPPVKATPNSVVCGFPDRPEFAISEKGGVQFYILRPHNATTFWRTNLDIGFMRCLRNREAIEVTTSSGRLVEYDRQTNGLRDLGQAADSMEGGADTALDGAPADTEQYSESVSHPRIAINHGRVFVGTDIFGVGILTFIQAPGVGSEIDVSRSRGNFALIGDRLLRSVGRRLELDDLRDLSIGLRSADDTVRIIDGFDGMHAATYLPSTSRLTLYDFSQGTGKIVGAFNVRASGSPLIALDPKAKLLTVADANGIARYQYDGTVRTIAWSEIGSDAGEQNAVLSPLGGFVVYQPITTTPISVPPASAVVFTTDGKRIGLVPGYGAPEKVHPLVTFGRRDDFLDLYALPSLRKANLNGGAVNSSGSDWWLSPDGRTRVTMDPNAVTLTDAATDLTLGTLPIPNGIALSDARISADSRYLALEYVALDKDGGIPPAAREQVAIFDIDRRDWYKWLCRALNGAQINVGVEWQPYINDPFVAPCSKMGILVAPTPAAVSTGYYFDK